jgi:hypothetical protein
MDATQPMPSSIQPSQDAVVQLMQGRSLSPAIAPQITESLQALVNPNGVDINGYSASTALYSALTGGPLHQPGYRVEIDPVTFVVEVRTPIERYLTAISSIRQVPASLTEGIYFGRDGQAIVVNEGFAIELAPTASDIVSFMVALSQAGLQGRLRNNATFEIPLGNGQRFSGAFGYDNQIDFECACGGASFAEPTGAPNSPQHTYKINYANGSQQTIVPFLDNPAVYTSLRATNLPVSTDRNTGVITIVGVGALRPSYFVTAPSAADSAFLTQFGDANGIAVRALNANNDGIADYEIISSTGVQVVYGL